MIKDGAEEEDEEEKEEEEEEEEEREDSDMAMDVDVVMDKPAKGGWQGKEKKGGKVVKGKRVEEKWAEEKKCIFENFFFGKLN